ncbi:hypothetical protein ACFFIX_07955 [Metabacillus herbersteinensis]|uniref:Uncharacterized protein n=1 Tax=Metabacillus herbersteinensis TaxID=283816 RepID=A0ABV6GDB7_9BACI
MSMLWFDRISAELQDHLTSICEKYDQSGNMSIDRASKHPRIDFFLEMENMEEREYFSTLSFDPKNEEFYVETFDYEVGQLSRLMLPDIEEIIDTIHDHLHDYLNEEEMDVTAEEFFEEIEVEWETPEVTAVAYKDEVEITYQFGILKDTGDGVLRRISRLTTEENEIIKDENSLIFSREEASTIIAMIASHMESLTDLASYE